MNAKLCVCMFVTYSRQNGLTDFDEICNGGSWHLRLEHLDPTSLKKDNIFAAITDIQVDVAESNS